MLIKQIFYATMDMRERATVATYVHQDHIVQIIQKGSAAAIHVQPAMILRQRYPMVLLNPGIAYVLQVTTARRGLLVKDGSCANYVLRESIKSARAMVLVQHARRVCMSTIAAQIAGIVVVIGLEMV